MCTLAIPQNYAEKLVKESNARNVQAELVPLADYDPDENLQVCFVHTRRLDDTSNPLRPQSAR